MGLGYILQTELVRDTFWAIPFFCTACFNVLLRWQWASMRRRVYTGQAKCKESTSKLGHVYQGRFALLVSVINIYELIMYEKELQISIIWICVSTCNFYKLMVAGWGEEGVTVCEGQWSYFPLCTVHNSPAVYINLLTALHCITSI